MTIMVGQFQARAKDVEGDGDQWRREVSRI